MADGKKKVATLTLTEPELATILWSLAVTIGMEYDPRLSKLLDSVPKMAKQDPFRGEKLREFGQKLAVEADYYFNQKII